MAAASHDSPQNIGIVAFDCYFPKHFVKQADLGICLLFYPVIIGSDDLSPHGILRFHRGV